MLCLVVVCLTQEPFFLLGHKCSKIDGGMSKDGNGQKDSMTSRRSTTRTTDFALRCSVSLRFPSCRDPSCHRNKKNHGRLHFIHYTNTNHFPLLTTLQRTAKTGHHVGQRTRRRRDCHPLVDRVGHILHFGSARSRLLRLFPLPAWKGKGTKLL